MRDPKNHRGARALINAATVPLALGILAGIATSMLPTAVGLGILAALLVGVIALQIEMQVAMERADIEAQVLLRELDPIVSVSQASQCTGEFLVKLATAQTNFLKAHPRPPVVFDEELAYQQQSLLERYEECAKGKMSVSLVAAPVFRETDGVSTVKNTLCATSLVPPATYWDGVNGISYLKQQEGMLEEGISIRRVFIQPPDTLSELYRVMERHLEWRERYGRSVLDVRVVLLNDRLDDDLIVDFAVIDDSTVIRLDTAHGIDHPIAVVWESGRGAVAGARTRFERLWKSGHDPATIPAFQELMQPA